MNDAELLAQFVRDRSEQAFAGLVRRHVDWVYSTALRRVRDAHLAEDVTQAVFTVLATRAHSLGRQRVLSAWLFHVVSNISAQALRQETRRRRHETQAAKHMQMTNDASSRAQWDQIERFVDRLVGQLKRAEREAVMLRFYERRSFVEIGTLLGISEEAARKRVSRAVDKLRTLMGPEMEAISTTALAGMLLAEMTKPAPAALASTISSVGAGSSLAKAFVAAMTWGQMKLAAVIGICFLAFGGGTIVLLLQLSAPAQTAVPSNSMTTQIADSSARARDLLNRYQQSLDGLARIHYRYRDETRYERDYNFDAVPKFKRIDSGEFFREGNRLSLLHTIETLNSPDQHQSATRLYRLIRGADNLPPEDQLSFQSSIGKPESRWRLGVDSTPRPVDEMLRSSGVEELWGYAAGEAEMQPLTKLLSNAPNLSIRSKMEQIDGHDTVVIDAHTRSGKHSLWIDPTAGYFARRIEVHKTGDDLDYSQPLNHPPPKLQPPARYIFPLEVAKSWDRVADHIQIDQIGGVFVPVSVSVTDTRTFVDGKVAIMHSECKREEIDLHPDFAAAHAFTMDVPDGTPVDIADNEKPEDPHFEWQAGKVVQIERLYGRAMRDGAPLSIAWKAQIRPDDEEARASVNWSEDMRPDGLFSVTLTSSERELLMKNCAGQITIYNRSGTLGEVNISELSTDRDHPPQFTFPRKDAQNPAPPSR